LDINYQITMKFSIVPKPKLFHQLDTPSVERTNFGWPLHQYMLESSITTPPLRPWSPSMLSQLTIEGRPVAFQWSCLWPQNQNGQNSCNSARYFFYTFLTFPRAIGKWFSRNKTAFLSSSPPCKLLLFFFFLKKLQPPTVSVLWKRGFVSRNPSQAE